MNSKLLPLAAFFAAMTISACKCDRTIVDHVHGEIGVVSQKDGSTVTDRDAVLDFGPVFDSQPVTQKIVVKNLGRGALTLSALEFSSGSNDVMSIKFEPTTLSASDFVELEATFSPPEKDDPVDYTAVFILRAENTDEGAETATITLEGKGVPGVCKLPSVIDFGNVQVDDDATDSIAIANPAAIPADASIGEITSSSGDDKAFTFGPDSLQPGTTTLDPGTTRSIDLDFHPTQAKSYLAFLKARASAQCPEQPITLVGAGVTSVLTWTPPKLDFGYVTPTVELVKDVTFSNSGKSDVTLSAIAVKPASNKEFYVVAEGSADATTQVVPKAQRDANGVWTPGSVTLKVATKPQLLGPRTASLYFNTSLPKQPSGSVNLTVFGGGADIDVKPSPTLNFGKIAYFAGANPPAYTKKTLSVMNVGTSPPGNDPKANLHITNVMVTPLNADTAADEFTWALPSSYDATNGLPAKANQNTAGIVVTLTPQSIGQKQAKIEIFSDDPDEPVVSVIAVADAVMLPPCNYTVSPTVLSFGLVSPPQYRDLGITFTNNGTNPGDTCLLSNVDIVPPSDNAFSLPAGGIDQVEVAAGETKQILVRVWPQGQTPTGVSTITGQVKLYVSSPVKPEATVSLTAQLAAPCVTIAPNDLDYGTVQIGCSSQTRTFSMYNTCSTPVTINSVSLQSAAGEPAGGPNCPGTQACPEFVITGQPAIGANGLQLKPGDPAVTFQAKYKPIDSGADTGAIAISVNQSSTNVTYVVPLHGKGDTTGIQTDVYTQDAKPKADILLVIDDSGSMSTYQSSLATNFQSFIKYAESASVDYHIAVIATEAGGHVYGTGPLAGTTLPYGQFFVNDPSIDPETVLTPNTPNVQAKFQAKVNVGTTGGTEYDADPALTALTPPLVNGANAGFLRNDAALAIVAITDANDQSPNNSSYYLNGFWNLKGFNRKSMFTFNAIAGFSPSCIPNVESADSGELAFYVAQTNGVKDDICTTNWSKTLEQLGKIAFGFRTNFFMTSVPDLTKGPIEVDIDGLPIDPVDARGASVWTYDSVQNSVNFEPMYVPEPGQTLTITYHTTCYP